MRKENIIANNQLMKIIPDVIKNETGNICTNIKFIGGGSNGKAFKVTLDTDERIVVKAFRYIGANTVEAKALTILGSSTKVKMPSVLFTHDEDNISLMAMTLIEGHNALNPLFILKSKRKKKNFAEDVINGLLDIHSVTGEKFGEIDSPRYESWLEYYNTVKLKPTLDGIKKLTAERKFSKNKYKLLMQAAEMYNKIKTEPECPILIHGDLNIMNIMAEPKSFKLTGFIDPLGTMYADRDYDLYQLQNMWGNCFKLYETYKKMANIKDETIDFKVTFYGTINEVSCRLGNGLILPLWEDLWFLRLRKVIKKMPNLAFK